MNRWRQRFAELVAAGSLSQPVQNVQNVQNGPLGLDFEHSEQFEQRTNEPRELHFLCPEGFSPLRWELLRQGAVRFAAEWADKALSFGWTYDELFAVEEPFARVELQGAAWFIGDATLTAVTADAITLRSASGATQRLYRRSLQ